MSKLFKWVGGGIAGVAAVIALLTVSFGPWIYHIVWCIQNVTADRIDVLALLVVGMVIAPVGWVHGIALVLGYTWV